MSVKTRFESAADVKRYMKERGVAIVRVKRTYSPFSGNTFFTATVALSVPGTVVSSGGSKKETTWYSDNPEVAQILNAAQEASRDTNITIEAEETTNGNDLNPR